MAKSKQKNYSYPVILISLIVYMIFRLYITSSIGSKGVAYLSVGETLFILIALSLAAGIEHSVGLLVENRMNKQMYDNVKKTVGAGGFLSIGLGIVFMGILLLAGRKISDNLYNMPLSYMSVIICALAIPLFVLSGTFRGFFRGIGKFTLVCQSYIIFAVSYVLFGSVFSFLLVKYGTKVASLLRVEDYIGAYGAVGFSLGLLVASFVCLLHMGVLYGLMNKRTVYGQGRDYSKKNEPITSLILTVLLNGLTTIAVWFAVSFVLFINGLYVFRVRETEFSMEFSYGEYYGKVFPISLLITAILGLLTFKNIRSSLHFVYREELRSARERLAFLIHRCVAVGLFATALLIALSGNILDILYKTNGSEVAGHLRLQSACIIFALFAIVFFKLLSSLGYGNIVMIICVLSSAVHAFLSFILVHTAGMSITGIIISDLIFWIIAAAMGYVIIARCFQYTQEWFRTFLVSFIAAGIVCLISLLINKVLSSILGKGVCIAIVVAVGALLEIIVLILLRGYSEEELEGSVLGKVMLAIGHTFNLL